jgi:hypothetical protein
MVNHNEAAEFDRFMEHFLEALGQAVGVRTQVVLDDPADLQLFAHAIPVDTEPLRLLYRSSAMGRSMIDTFIEHLSNRQQKQRLRHALRGERPVENVTPQQR